MNSNQKNLIVLVRHGESEYNRDGIIQGQSDNSVLTDNGKVQVEAIGNWLQGLNNFELISSPLRRCTQTSQIIASIIGTDPAKIRIDSRLLEIDFGSWTGKKRDCIIEEFKESYHIWRTRPFDLYLNGHYPVRSLYDRITELSNELSNPISLPTAQIIVAHRGVISALVVSLLHFPKSHHHFLQIDRGSVTILQEISRTKSHINYELVCANERPHAATRQPVDFETEERTKSQGDIFLVRHGQTNANIDRRYQGGKDLNLSNIGCDNMTLLAKSFIPRFPTRVISSPLQRAKESAAILCNQFGVRTISERKDLHEFLYGIWEGMTEEDVRKYRMSEYSQWKNTPVLTEIPNAEHINDAYNRCRDIWEYYENDIQSWGGSIVSVAHDIVNRLLICNALDLPAGYIWRFRQTNASVTVLAVKQSYDGKLRMLNHSPYSLAKRLSDAWL